MVLVVVLGMRSIMMSKAAPDGCPIASIDIVHLLRNLRPDHHLHGPALMRARVRERLLLQSEAVPIIKDL